MKDKKAELAKMLEALHARGWSWVELAGYAMTMLGQEPPRTVEAERLANLEGK